MITLGKRGDLHARRQAAAVIREQHATRKLFTELADRYRSVAGGYTRIVKLGLRRGDGAMLSLIELVKPEDRTPGRKKKTTKKSATARKPGTKGATAKKGEPKAKKGSAGS
jgi:large subunit ribosomal protein L17